MTERLLSPTFLFRFAAPCRYRKEIWTKDGVELPETHRLPHFAQLDGAPTLADVRMAWNEHGLAFCVEVQGKRHSPWCRESHLDESDGLHVWIDTRDTHNIHRASRFCHAFAFLPAGGGARRDRAAAGQMIINRAREHAQPARAACLKVRSEKRVDGYLLQAAIAAEGLTGFDPAEHPRLGFTYAIVDRERGDQTFTVSNEVPYQEDPSLWATLELTK